MSMASEPNAGSNLDLNRVSQPAENPHLDNGYSDHGSMRVSASELHYTGSNHWATILDSIADLKDHFEREEQLRLFTRPDQIQDDTTDVGNFDIQASRHSLLLYGSYRQASKAEIFAALPPKSAVDRYISRYFNCPPRPETEVTTVLGTIARRRMLTALGTISDLTANVKSCNYAEVMRADAILHEAAASVPQPLKMKSMTASITDSPQVIMSRLFVSHLFYKGQVMLHRRFVLMDLPSAGGDSLSYSRKACLDASLSMLQIQHTLDEETCPGGRLHMMRWRVSSIINHQFLTATMILCSLLHRGQASNRKDEIIATLRSTRAIWMRGSSVSQEAKKAAETVNFVLVRTGETHDRGIDLDSECTSAVTIGQDISANSNSSDAGLAFDGPAMLQTTKSTTNLYECKSTESHPTPRS